MTRALVAAFALFAFAASPATTLAQTTTETAEPIEASTFDLDDELPPPSPGRSTPLPPPPTTAPDVADPAQIALLDAWLSTFDRSARISRYVTSPLGILAGGALAGLGIWGITDESFTDGTVAALGGGMIALGVMSIGVGIYNFAVSGPNEQLYARFVVARDAGLSPQDFGRFEGELRAMAEVSRTARRASIASGFLLALGGGVAVAVSATVDVDEARFYGMVTGGGLALAGALIGGLSFIPSSYERAWKKYELGLTPDGEAPSVSVLPAVGPGGAALRISGTF